VFLHRPHATLDLEPVATDGCRACHPAGEDGALSFRFRRAGEEPPADALADLYHDACTGCHTGAAAEAGRPGPDGCGECHVRRPRVAAAQAPVVMDIPLHARHVQAHDGKCEGCHHVFDEATRRLVYREGEEGSCRDCHGPEPVDGKPSLRTVFHGSCVNCHLQRADSGPTDCAGCHDDAVFAAWARPEPAPRLQRGQPDRVLVHAAADDIPEMEQPSVPFDHRAHEGAVPTCRTCHHRGMQACNVCHTLAGDEAGGGVPLAVAYHAQGTDHSCVGCHQTRTAAGDCAGCHTFLPRSALSSDFCGRCHAGPPPAELAAAGAAPEPAAHHFDRELAPSVFTGDEVPETVTVGALADRYEPAVFPHRKVVDRLRADIAASGLAAHFHAEDDLACTGCHHHSPVGVRPPACGNCHGEPFQPANLNAPGLYGAYHQQCVGCHQQLGLPTGCTDCHAERGTAEVARAARP
jgi:hypothetical protein